MTAPKSLSRFTLADRLTLLLAEGFGLGQIPFAPGTFGSLWGILIGWGLWQTETSPVQRIAMCGALFILGIPICHRGAQLRNSKDPGSIVWDEITAFPIVYAFDIVKPWPVKQFEKLPGGLGIMADDVVAGIYAAACLAVMQSFES